MRARLGADRVVYLGSDRMLDEVVGSWARELVGPFADDQSIMRRATEKCQTASPQEIEVFS
jgi:hypothetical protein